MRGLLIIHFKFYYFISNWIFLLVNDKFNFHDCFLHQICTMDNIQQIANAVKKGL